MHRDLKRLLKQATGVSEMAVAAVIDIRGFTQFCEKQESPAVAHFLKRAYLVIVEQYYPQSRFFKPTGDGLLVIRNFSERNLTEVLTETVRASLRLIDDFPQICAGDPMVNFSVPGKVGIGVSRGSVCALVAGKDPRRTLDYSGRCLNLASRLMDIARPAGVVLDSDFGIDLLPSELAEAFAEDSVYIRSTAEHKPAIIYYSKDHTVISAIHRQPIDEPKYEILDIHKLLRDVEKTKRNFAIGLPSQPLDPSQIVLRVGHASVIHGKASDTVMTWRLFRHHRYRLEAGVPELIVEFDRLARICRQAGVKGTWPLVLRISYAKMPPR